MSMFRERKFKGKKNMMGKLVASFMFARQAERGQYCLFWSCRRREQHRLVRPCPLRCEWDTLIPLIAAFRQDTVVTDTQSAMRCTTKITSYGRTERQWEWIYQNDHSLAYWKTTDPRPWSSHIPQSFQCLYLHLLIPLTQSADIWQRVCGVV